MREVFPREAATRPEPFTGERLTASVHGQVEIEHYHRYLFARAFCRGKDVLDVASGEGYGAAHLARVARRVVGLEQAGGTVRNAAANFPLDNLCFVQGDARALPLTDASADVVTSFETIEHFDDQETFVAEVRRVLRPEGCFIVSTPDRDVYSSPGQQANPYHVREFDRVEFLQLLQRHFRFVSLVRQRPLLGSALIPEEPAPAAPLIFERCDGLSFSADSALPGAPYLIAIATELGPRTAPMSLLIDRSDLDNVMFADQEAELTGLKAELERLRAVEIAAGVAAETARVAAETARVSAERAREAVEAAHAAARATREAAEIDRRTYERLLAEAHAVVASLTRARAVLTDANQELERVNSSARLFLRQYFPRLWRHLFR